MPLGILLSNDWLPNILKRLAYNVCQILAWSPETKAPQNSKGAEYYAQDWANMHSMYKIWQGNSISHESNVTITVNFIFFVIQWFPCLQSAWSPCRADDFIRELVGCRALVHHDATIVRQVPRTVHHIHEATQNRNHRVLLPNFPVAYRWPCSGLTQVASHIDQLYWKALAASTCRILHGKDFMDFDQDKTADIVLEMYQNY